MIPSFIVISIERVSRFFKEIGSVNPVEKSLMIKGSSQVHTNGAYTITFLNGSVEHKQGAYSSGRLGLELLPILMKYDDVSSRDYTSNGLKNANRNG